MAVWRRKLIDEFPPPACGWDDSVSCGDALADLAGRLDSMWDRDDAEDIDRILGYARWCWEQPTLRRTAEVMFYCPVAMTAHGWEQFPKRVPREIVDSAEPHLRAKLGGEAVDRLLKRYQANPAGRKPA